MQEGSVSLWTNLVELKIALGIDPQDCAEDANLSQFASSATAIIEQYLNRRGYLKRERTEYYGGSGTQSLQLLSLPVHLTPTPRVWVDDVGGYGEPTGSFDASRELVYGTGFVVDRPDGEALSVSGLLIRLGDFWNRPVIRQRGFLSPVVGQSFGNVKVVYTGGHTPATVPADITLAARILVARMRMMFPLGTPLMSESYEDRSISQWNGQTDTHWLTGEVKHLLFPHRRHRF